MAIAPARLPCQGLGDVGQEGQQKVQVGGGGEEYNASEHGTSEDTLIFGRGGDTNATCVGCTRFVIFLFSDRR
ncbi:hypothetical protein ABBQ38_000146 [Trebouxia sp. C0009 RCD-2024]